MAYAMIATKAGGSEVFEKQEIDLPKPAAGEVLMRQTAIGVNFIDVYHRTGLYPAPGGLPGILGCEGAGVVESVGEGVTGFQEGDRVAYTVPGGAYATHRTISADKIVKIPDGVSDEQAAACMLKGLTAEYLINNSYAVKSGDTVLVHAAAGGVGSIAGQWLKQKGVTAIGTAGGPEKCELAKKNGYAHVIDYRSENFVEEVMKFTDGKGVPAVYDSVGKDTYPGSLQVLENHGTFVSFGQSSGIVADFKLADLAANGSLYATRPTLFHFISTPEELSRRAGLLFDVMSSGDVRIDVNQTFKLDDLKAAHDALEGRQTTGQTILTV